MREGVQSSLTCPLTVNDRKFGVIFLSSREPRAYTPYHVQLWMAIAERLAQAVEKVWRIEQLQAANQAYLEMLAFVSHELKNPIASMMTDARVLADGYLGDLQPKQAQKLERLIGKGNHLLELIRVYLDLARMEGGDLVLRPRLSAFIEEVVDPAVDLIQPQLQARRMVLDRLYPDGPEPIQCDPDLLQIVLVNLLGNAVKYGQEGGRIRLTVERLVDELRLTVWNQGPRLPARGARPPVPQVQPAARPGAARAQGQRGSASTPPGGSSTCTGGTSTPAASTASGRNSSSRSPSRYRSTDHGSSSWLRTSKPSALWAWTRKTVSWWGAGTLTSVRWSAVPRGQPGQGAHHLVLAGVQVQGLEDPVHLEPAPAGGGELRVLLLPIDDHVGGLVAGALPGLPLEQHHRQPVLVALRGAEGVGPGPGLGLAPPQRLGQLPLAGQFPVPEQPGAFEPLGVEGAQGPGRQRLGGGGGHHQGQGRG